MLSFKDIKFLLKNKKARDTQGLFVAEGRKLFLEAPKEDVEQVLMSKTFAGMHPEYIGMLKEHTDVIADIEDARFASLTDTKTPQGILTVIRKPHFDLQQTLAGSCPLIMILEDLQDPGNVGTILRTAEAAGVTAVFLTENCADLYSPKATRATMGSIYRVPHFHVSNAPELIEWLQEQCGVTSYAAHLRGTRSYTDCTYRKGSAFVIGNEGNGITDAAAEACGELIRIPMMGQVESLNAAMAAGVLMFEAQRQRRAL
ncbi:MAG: RNA methyltransferase [Lachnospiraceae bacterium]|nr:RNA methyltransferase [Lachnospiraceae bacterium]